MKSISNTVEEIVYKSDVAFFALQDGILNLSAFAKQIKKKVQNECKKPIKSTAAIIMALSRLQKKIAKNHVTLPKMFFTSVTIKRNLREIVVPKTKQSIQLIARLIGTNDEPPVLLVTYGLNQINIVIQETQANKIKKTIAPLSPSFTLSNLVSITLGTLNGYTSTPNIFYSILSHLATREINIIEIATTQTEITLIIDQSLLPKLYEALSDLIEEKEKLY